MFRRQVEVCFQYFLFMVVDFLEGRIYGYRRLVNCMSLGFNVIRFQICIVLVYIFVFIQSFDLLFLIDNRYQGFLEKVVLNKWKDIGRVGKGIYYYRI